MKAIMISIQPKWVAKILNGEKTIEIRKTMPKDFEGWVYIYCTKDKSVYLVINKETKRADLDYGFSPVLKSKEYVGNGKVVARFYFKKGELISYNYRSDFTSVYTDTLDTEDLEKQACLTRHEFAKYLQGNYGYAWHIDNLEIFDRPKELGEFINWKYAWVLRCGSWVVNKDSIKLTKAPQSWGYIEV